MIDLGQGRLRPDYGGGSIVNVAASVLDAFGVEPPSPPLRADLLPEGGLAGPGGTVLLVLDALGHAQLTTALEAGCSPRLAELVEAAGLRRLTSIFPSTTTAALHSLATACPPAAHGVLGHILYLEELDEVVNMLTLHPIGAEAPIDEGLLRRVPTIYERLAGAGVPSVAITDAAYEGTPFTNLLVEGAAFAGYAGLSQIPFQLQQALTEHAGRPLFVSIYWPLVDTLSHTHGPDHVGSPSAACRWEMEFLDLLVDRVAGLCRRHGCTLAIVADHGQTALLPERATPVAGPFLRQLRRWPGGGRRVPYFHGVTPARVADEFAGPAPPLVVAAEEAVAEGWFGPPGDLCDGLGARVGDVIALAGEGVQFLCDYGRGTHAQRGSHAGLTEHEMYVPLLVLPADAAA